jgi:hypothetical protein
MGNKCNSRYKIAQDILIKDDGNRRKVFDPYNHFPIRLSLENSQPFAGKINSNGLPLPKWQIDFDLDSEEISTWNEVFSVKERYERDVLNESFLTWLRDFWKWCKSAKIKPDSAEKLTYAIRDYTAYQEELGFNDRAFFRAAVFQMLHAHCLKGNQRLIDFIMDVALGTG